MPHQPVTGQAILGYRDSARDKRLGARTVCTDVHVQVGVTALSEKAGVLKFRKPGI